MTASTAAERTIRSAQAAGVEHARPRRDWPIALGTAVVAAVLSLIPRIFSSTFYYWDDMMQSFLPLWRHLGLELRAGHYPLMEPSGWIGGNTIAEVGYGIFNPVNIMNSFIVSFFDNLTWASYIIVVQFIGILAFATYMLARDFGANRPLAAAAGAALPFCGFTLFYESARWPGGLMAFAWVTLFWWALRRYAHRHTSPFLPFAVGFCTMTAGNPYGAIGVIVVLAAVTLELVLTRHWRRVITLVLVGALVGLTAVLVYFPLPLSSAVTVRTSSTIAQDLFLTPDLSSIFAMSTPVVRPRINNFWGPIDSVPSSYLAWFVLPLLPWLDFRSITKRSRQLFSLYVVALVYFLLTFGPSNVLVFRWPVRLIEYVYLCVIVLVAAMASAGLRTSRWKIRLAVTLAIVLMGAYYGWSMVPNANKSAVAGLALTLALIAAAMWAWRRFGFRGIGAVMVVGTAAVLALQSALYIPKSPVAGIGSPTDTRLLAASTAEYQGNTLQIFDTKTMAPSDFTSGRLLYGNQILNANVQNSLGRYSGISFTTFANALCMNYRGEACPLAFGMLYKPASDQIPVPLADVLNLQTLVMQRQELPKMDFQVPAGWKIAASDDTRIILHRTSPLNPKGDVSWTSQGVSVVSSTLSGTNERVTLDGHGAPGQLTLARLAWPGYTITVDGEAQPLKQGPAGVILVDVPANASTVDVTFTPPGFTAGLAAQALAWLGAIVMTIVYYASRRRRARRGLPTSAVAVAAD